MNPYYNSTFYDLLQDFDVAEAGSAEAIALAHDMQEIIASELPSIPIAYNAIWYTVNEKYWKNFPTEENDWLHPTTTWSTANPGAMNRLIMGLRATGVTDEVGTATPISIIPFLFAIAVISYFASKRRK